MKPIDLVNTNFDFIFRLHYNRRIIESQQFSSANPGLIIMRNCYFFLFSFLCSLHLNGQNCKRLDAQSFFSSTRFGGQISPALADCAKRAHDTSQTNNIFLRIEYDSLKPACRKNYADLFTFHSVPFSFTQISANPKGEILSVEYYSFFRESQAKASSNDSPLPAFKKLYKKLESLYGKPTQISAPTAIDSLLMNEKGMEQIVSWSCSTVDLQLRVFYGAPQKWINVLHVAIRNYDYDRPGAVELLQ